MTQQPAVWLDHLAVGYGRAGHHHVVARQLSAGLEAGRLTCLLGSNGVGKSTLLRTLCGLQAPLEGDVRLMGRPLRSYGTAALARIVGIVLTVRVDADNMRVADLVAMGRTPYTGFWGTLGEDDRRAVAQAMRLVSIETFARRMVRNLSDGERQKVMIAKTLAQHVPVMLLDEPTAFLDYPSKVEVMRLLRQVARQEHKAVLLSTHDVEMALHAADDLWLMDSAGLRQGTPASLAANGCLRAFFARDGLDFDSATARFNWQDGEM